MSKIFDRRNINLKGKKDKKTSNKNNKKKGKSKGKHSGKNKKGNKRSNNEANQSNKKDKEKTLETTKFKRYYKSHLDEFEQVYLVNVTPSISQKTNHVSQFFSGNFLLSTARE